MTPRRDWVDSRSHFNHRVVIWPGGGGPLIRGAFKPKFGLHISVPGHFHGGPWLFQVLNIVSDPL